MKTATGTFLIACAALWASAGGCMVASRAELEGVESRNRVLAEQHRAHLAEIENLKVHSRSTEDQLAAAEQKLVLLERKVQLQHGPLADREPDAVADQGKRPNEAPVSPATRTRFEQFARMYPALRFDPHSGVGRLEDEILFDSGRAEIKDGALPALKQLVELLKSPEGRDLRALVVGHTDDRPPSGESRQQFADNVALSTSRAKAVADQLRRLGLEESRLGVAGFGSHQPLASNATFRARQKNRRVEVFVMAPEAPVVGWTESVPSLYK